MAGLSIGSQSPHEFCFSDESVVSADDPSAGAASASASCSTTSEIGGLSAAGVHAATLAWMLACRVADP